MFGIIISDNNKQTSTDIIAYNVFLKSVMHIYLEVLYQTRPSGNGCFRFSKRTNCEFKINSKNFEGRMFFQIFF